MKMRLVFVGLVLALLGGAMLWEKFGAWSDLPEGTERISFSDLASYEYQMPRARDVREGNLEEQVPEGIRSMDGSKVALEGFMVVLESDGERVQKFVCSRYIGGCCYGQQPNMNEWVDVDVVDADGCDYLHDRTVIVTGSLEVGEKIDPRGYVESLYRIRADEVRDGGPLDLSLVGWGVALALFFLLTAPFKKKEKSEDDE